MDDRSFGYKLLYREIDNKFMLIIVIILTAMLLLPDCTNLGILDFGIQYKRPGEISEQHVKDWINEVKDKEGDFFIAKSIKDNKEIYYLYLDPHHFKIKADKKNIYVSGIKRGESNSEDKRIFKITMEEKRKPKAIIINGTVIPTKSIPEIGGK